MGKWQNTPITTPGASALDTSGNPAGASARGRRLRAVSRSGWSRTQRGSSCLLRVRWAGRRRKSWLFRPSSGGKCAPASIVLISKTRLYGGESRKLELRRHLRGPRGGTMPHFTLRPRPRHRTVRVAPVGPRASVQALRAEGIFGMI